MVYENPGFIGGITKELYPDLSIKFNTSIPRVERAIRHAIEVSWLRGDIDLMEEIFGHSVDIDRAKPTNSRLPGCAICTTPVLGSFTLAL